MARTIVWLSALGVVSLAGVADAAPRSELKLPLKTAGAASDVVVLDGGEKVPAKQYAAEMNQLQEALETDGVSLKKSDNKPPTKKLYVVASTPEEDVRDKAAITAKATALAVIANGNFAALRKKKAGAGGAPSRKGAVSAGADPAPGMMAPVDNPENEDPLDVTYQETLGSNKRASIYVAMTLKDTGDAGRVGCDASLDGGIYLFDDKKQLVKLSASGKSGPGGLSGSVDLFLVGKSVDGFPKRGSTSTANATKSIAPPPAKMSYGWGPISVQVNGSIAGELRVTGANTQEGVTSTQKGKCTASVQPMVRASAKASASVSAIAYKVGVEGQIVLLDVKTPVTSSVTLAGNPNSLSEDFRAQVNAVFLDGDVAFFVKTRIPQSNERFWDLDWDQVYRKVLFDWDGLRINSKLAEFSGRRTTP